MRFGRIFQSRISAEIIAAAFYRARGSLPSMRGILSLTLANEMAGLFWRQGETVRRWRRMRDLAAGAGHVNEAQNAVLWTRGR
jgi:hypothetical protein